MSRILLADQSPHAQRMGERILREEGFEVVAVTDGDTALLRLNDVQPDLVIADVSLPGRSGYEIRDYVRNSGNHPATRVVLTAGPLASCDEEQLRQAGGFLRKPFEASALLAAIQPLLEGREPAKPKEAGEASRPVVAVLDREQVRAAVMRALERIGDAVTDEVFTALRSARKHAGQHF